MHYAGRFRRKCRGFLFPGTTQTVRNNKVSRNNGCLYNADRIPADGGCGWEHADRKMQMEKRMRIAKKVRRKKNEKCGWQKNK